MCSLGRSPDGLAPQRSCDVLVTLGETLLTLRDQCYHMTRDNRTLSELTFETEDGQSTSIRTDVGAPEDENHNQVPAEEADHHNIVESIGIREEGNRTIANNRHVEF